MKQNHFQNCLDWFVAENAPQQSTHICAYRDVFQARLDTFFLQLKSRITENDLYLLTAILGEIGNNCFDHNLGQWQDIPGCWFEHARDKNRLTVVIADRGQGILSSLKKTNPQLKDDQQAIASAFEKIVSGRSPEKRGNGLKFVARILNHGQQRGLCCVSGKGWYPLGKLGEAAKAQLAKTLANKTGKGTLAYIHWDIS